MIFFRGSSSEAPAAGLKSPALLLGMLPEGWEIREDLGGKEKRVLDR